MAATSSSASSTSVVLPIAAGWKPEEITPSAVQTLFVKKFTEFVAEYQERRQAKELKDLAIGPWYANDYALACKKHGQLERLEFLIKKNALHDGFPPRGFVQLSDPTNVTGIEFWSYQIQKEILPTEGLQSIKTGRFSFIDCQGAIEIALYETIHEIFGSIRFNEIFSGTGKHPLQIHIDWTQTPLHYLGLVIQRPLDPNSPGLEPGDQVNFPNIPLYENKHLLGEFGGLNVICISPTDSAEKQYIGFGTSPDGQTGDQITDLLIDAFNETPIDSSLILSKELVDHFRKVDQLRLTLSSKTTEHTSFHDITVEKTTFQKTIREVTKTDLGHIPFCNRLSIEGISKLMTPPPKSQAAPSSSSRKMRGPRRGGRR
jgi:hypothetical protein